MASGTTVVIPSHGGNIISTSAPQQIPQKGPLERFLKAEPKVLGAIQIMIGLILLTFGAISICFIPPYYFTLIGVGGYPFWGAIFVKSSVGMNITSAIIALTGIILYLCELVLSVTYWRDRYLYRTDYEIGEAVYIIKSISFSLCFVLLLFSTLEFCIAVSLAHFGCQATCCSNAQPTVVYVPYQLIGGEEITAEPNPPTPPPTYDNTMTNI